MFVYLILNLWGRDLRLWGAHTRPRIYGSTLPRDFRTSTGAILKKHLNPLVKGMSSSTYACRRGVVVDRFWTDPFPSFIRLPW